MLLNLKKKKKKKKRTQYKIEVNLPESGVKTEMETREEQPRGTEKPAKELRQPALPEGGDGGGGELRGEAAGMRGGPTENWNRTRPHVLTPFPEHPGIFLRNERVTCQTADL